MLELRRTATPFHDPQAIEAHGTSPIMTGQPQSTAGSQMAPLGECDCFQWTSIAVAGSELDLNEDHCRHWPSRINGDDVDLAGATAPIALDNFPAEFQQISAGRVFAMLAADYGAHRPTSTIGMAGM
jgi:hypothetical protein